MSDDGGVRLVERLLHAQVGQRVLAEDGAGVQVGRQKPAVARQTLRRDHKQASHSRPAASTDWQIWVENDTQQSSLILLGHFERIFHSSEIF